MKKNTRGHIANPGSKRRRVLQLSQETVKVLSSSELSQAIGGSGCVTTSWSTEAPPNTSLC